MRATGEAARATHHPMPAMTTAPHNPIDALDLSAANAELESVDAAQVVAWARDTFGSGLVMSTSFGVQSAVMLHLVTQVVPEIPVIFIDTGFHFLDTYKFADELTERLHLNLKVYQPTHSLP